MTAQPFFSTRFAVRLGRDSGGDHWLGGTGHYRGAVCPVCRVPLLLVFDINCADPILRKASGGKFSVLKRLPLYVCARCFCELSYVVTDGEVRIVQTKYGNPGSEQYLEYPDHFPRRPIALDAEVPAALPRVIQKWNPDIDLRGEKLSPAERRLLEDFFVHPIFIPKFMYHHQLGGESLCESWDENAFLCPNKKCSGGWWDKLLRRSRPMSFLAGVLNDPPGGLPLVEPLNKETATKWNYFVSFYFQICDRCLTVTTFSASD